MDTERDPLYQAEAALRAATRALERMKVARNFPDFEDAWQDFLGCLEKSWIKTERACQPFRNKFQPWQGRFDKRRKEDPLLRYLTHARNADEHTLEETVEHHPAHRTINPAYGNSLYIEHMEIRGGQIVSYSGDRPLVVRDYPARVELCRFRDRGAWYEPPAYHQGKKLQSREPVAVAELGLHFYTDFVRKARERFFTS